MYTIFVLEFHANYEMKFRTQTNYKPIGFAKIGNFLVNNAEPNSKMNQDNETNKINNFQTN